MTKRWQDAVNLLLGLWLFISPWALQYADAQTAAWNAYVMGTAIAVFAAVAVYMPKVWEELINIVCGVWLVISPCALGFASNRSVAANAMVVGLLSIGFAVWAMLKDVQFDKWWHEHHYL